MSEGRKFHIITFLLVILFPVTFFGQTIVRGVVTDAKTGEPLPFVSVILEGTTEGRNTDFNGQYHMETNAPGTKLKFVLVGYQTITKDIVQGQSQIISVKMPAVVKELKAVEIKGTKQRYRNKDNPAVELIDRVIEHKRQNRKEQLASYQYEKYEKVQFALSNITEKFKNRRYLKNFQFVFNNLDSNQMPGKVILPMYLQETLSDVYYLKSEKGLKEIVKGSHKVNYDDFVNSEGMGTFISYLYQDVNIYNNSVPILTNPFISPIADNGPLFYRYYIKDTVMVDSTKCYHLIFYPRNKADMVFQGELFITYDSNYAVKKNELTVSPDINLNFVKELKLTQEYTEVAPGEWMLNKDNIAIDFGLGPNGMGIYGQRALSFSDFVLDQPKPDTFYKGESVVTPDSAMNIGQDYFEKHRHGELTASEKGVYQMVDSVQKVPAFRHTINVLEFLFTGYKDFGPVEIGPISTFYSYNPIEGFRSRIGGRTTKQFSERIQLESYAVYGWKDERWKYFIGVKKAIGEKSYIDFPQKNIYLTYQRETKIPGQELRFVQEDNALLSFKRGVNDKLLYNKIFSAELQIENVNHFSYTIGMQNLIQTPGGSLHFTRYDENNPQGSPVNELQTSVFSLSLRYAPNEQFYQGKTYRTPMYNQYPIMAIRFDISQEGFLRSDYSYKGVTANIFKRAFMAPFGYGDIELEAGKTFGRVPYPLLEIHRANQTYSYQLESYNLMNFLEFVSDQYFSVFYSHYFQGFFFNKIPLLKKLKWREVATFKLLYGSISENNRPDKHGGLFQLPTNSDGSPMTYSLEARPYMEASVGVSNIFKLVRIDLVKRLTYLEHLNTTEFAVRARVKLDF